MSCLFLTSLQIRMSAKFGPNYSVRRPTSLDRIANRRNWYVDNNKCTYEHQVSRTCNQWVHSAPVIDSQHSKACRYQCESAACICSLHHSCRVAAYPGHGLRGKYAAETRHHAAGGNPSNRLPLDRHTGRKSSDRTHRPKVIEETSHHSSSQNKVFKWPGDLET